MSLILHLHISSSGGGNYWFGTSDSIVIFEAVLQLRNLIESDANFSLLNVWRCGWNSSILLVKLIGIILIGKLPSRIALSQIWQQFYSLVVRLLSAGDAFFGGAGAAFHGFAYFLLFGFDQLWQTLIHILYERRSEFTIVYGLRLILLVFKWNVNLNSFVTLT